LGYVWVVGRVDLWVQSFYFAMGWVGLKKLDPRTTVTYDCNRYTINPRMLMMRRRLQIKTRAKLYD